MKIFKTFIIALLLLFCASCSSTSEFPDNGNVNVMATIFPPYDFARELGGDNINLKMLLPPGSETHSYEPTPQDIINIQNSDLFIYAGGESDEWIRELLDSVDTKNIKILSLVDLCPLLEEENKEGMQLSGALSHEHIHDENCEHEHKHESDEHVWTSPKNVMLICNEICDILCELDPDNSETYSERLINYTSQLSMLDSSLREISEISENNTLIFADRFPFRYLTEEYSWNYYAAFPGCAEQTEPSIKTIMFLIDKIKEENIPYVFYREFSSHTLADTVAEETGAKTAMLHSCHNVTKQEFEAGITYIDLMTKNIEILKEALK